MKAKEKADDYSKEGCARVFMYKKFNIVHSYTLECGFHTPNVLNTLPAPREPNICYGQYRYTEVFENERDQFYTPQSYMNLGKAMLVSLLDVFDRNPYTRVANSEYKTLDNLRKTLSNSLYQSCERFRMMDPNCLKKLRLTNDLIKDYYNERFNYTTESEKIKDEEVPSPIRLPPASRSLKPLREKKMSTDSVEPRNPIHAHTSSVSMLKRKKEQRQSSTNPTKALPTRKIDTINPMRSTSELMYQTRLESRRPYVPLTPLES
jgi:hypothetical protein